MPDRPNLFQLIISKIQYIWDNYIYIFAKGVAHYFEYLQKPRINVIVCLLGLFILGKIYNSLAKKYYTDDSATIFQFCINQWIYLLMIFIVIYQFY
jgi:hypothetical protein